MFGAAFSIVPLSARGFVSPTGFYKNGYLYRLRRIIPGAIHGMPTGGTAWVTYRATGASLKSAANLGHVQGGAFIDHRFETGNGTVIAHELESWNGTTGDVVAHLTLTGFRKGADYALLHYYGKPALDAAESNPTAAWAGFDASVNMATGLDMSGHGRDFTLTGIAAGTLFGSAAGDLG